MQNEETNRNEPATQIVVIDDNVTIDVLNQPSSMKSSDGKALFYDDERVLLLGEEIPIPTEMAYEAYMSQSILPAPELAYKAYKYQDILVAKLKTDDDYVDPGYTAGEAAFLGYEGMLLSDLVSWIALLHSCRKLQIELTINDGDNSKAYIDLINTPTKIHSDKYKSAVADALKLSEKLDLICRNNRKMQSSGASDSSSQISITDEVLNYKKLVDIGAITQEEFETKTKQIFEP